MKDRITGQEITRDDLQKEIALLDKRIAQSKSEREEVIYLERKAKLERRLGDA
jgi:hypothetical protein